MNNQVIRKAIQVIEDWNTDMHPQDIYTLLQRLSDIEGDEDFAHCMNELRRAYKMAHDEL